MTDSEESWTSGLINEQLRKRFENHDSAKVTNLAGQTCIAAFMPPKKSMTFEGIAGDNFAGLNNGSKIVLNGDAGRFLGNGMSGGEIIVNGSCEEGVGHCLSGGTIVIQGSVDGDAGVSMKDGNLLISGTVRGNIATCMKGGRIVVCGDVMGDIGKMMDKGKILISGDFDKNENLDVMRCLLTKGVNINMHNGKGFNFLHVAADFGIVDVLGCDSMLIDFVDLTSPTFCCVLSLI